MPTPRPNETRSDFVGRCIPAVKSEEPGIASDHAIAKCHGIWEQNKKKSSKDK